MGARRPTLLGLPKGYCDRMEPTYRFRDGSGGLGSSALLTRTRQARFKRILRFSQAFYVRSTYTGPLPFRCLRCVPQTSLPSSRELNPSRFVTRLVCCLRKGRQHAWLRSRLHVRQVLLSARPDVEKTKEQIRETDYFIGWALSRPSGRDAKVNGCYVKRPAKLSNTVLHNSRSKNPCGP